MEDWEKAIKLEQFIRKYVPKGYREAIGVFDFVPSITEDNYREFESAYKAGNLTNTLKAHMEIIGSVQFQRFNKPYIIEAVSQYFGLVLA